MKMTKRDAGASHVAGDAGETRQDDYSTSVGWNISSAAGLHQRLTSDLQRTRQ